MKLVSMSTCNFPLIRGNCEAHEPRYSLKALTLDSLRTHAMLDQLFFVDEIVCVDGYAGHLFSILSGPYLIRDYVTYEIGHSYDGMLSWAPRTKCDTTCASRTWFTAYALNLSLSTSSIIRRKLKGLDEWNRVFTPTVENIVN